MRGPEPENCTPLFSALLKETRLVMIVAAVSARRPSLMAKAEWSAASNIPSEEYGSSTWAMSNLLDTLAQISLLYHEQDAIILDTRKSSSTNDKLVFCTARIPRLLDQVLVLLDQLASMITVWKASTPDSALTSIPCTMTVSLHPPPFVLVTKFSSVTAANIYSLYNSTVILLNQFALALYPVICMADIDMLEQSSFSDHLAVAILDTLKSMEYHLTTTEITRLEVSGPSNQFLHLSIRVAHRAMAQSNLHEDIARRCWLEDVSSYIAAKGGPWTSNRYLFRSGQPRKPLRSESGKNAV